MSPVSCPQGRGRFGTLGCPGVSWGVESRAALEGVLVLMDVVENQHQEVENRPLLCVRALRSSGSGLVVFGPGLRRLVEHDGVCSLEER